MQEKQKKMEKLTKEIKSLALSPLVQYRNENHYHAVFGDGSFDSAIVFIGEAPGKNEAQTGKTFCGKSGKVLDHLLKSIELERKDIYITNMVKDRPPENRDPLADEIELYGAYLRQEIDIIKPKVIATLGRFSMTYIMKAYGLEGDLRPISELHGKPFSAQAFFGPITIIPLYHPAVAVYNPKKIDDLKADFQVLKKFV